MLQWIEISRSAFLHNITHITSLYPQSDLGIVVKANAYGHGLGAIGKLCAFHPSVSWLCTAGIEEALLLRNDGITKRILAMSYTCDGLPESIVEHSIDTIVDDAAIVRELAFYAHKLGMPARVHLKVDTGLSRRGIAPGYVLAFSKMLLSTPFIKFEGICTHLSDNVGKDPTCMEEELDVLRHCLQELEDNGIRVPYVHALASAGITTFYLHANAHSHTQRSLVRIGGYAYGLFKSAEQQALLHMQKSAFSLKPILAWKSRITDLIDYNDQRLAFIPVSQAQGYPYSLIKKASIEVAGGQAPLVSSLGTSFLIADVKRVPHVKLYDVVTLVGATAGIDVYTLACMAQKKVNEFLVGIDQAIPRIVVD